ncbi:DNA internalization-related competence protein ComEC/Rec2 [Clostridium sp. MCC353]|uniref:DNA internalization-related competence protein ComEC/Rec2 n=1 Tax=Clostridium sp. MCC353 TaxID=2592646 RepID=UPI0023DF691D|nr:DNA internalization-related competence protein ComEC/Rec2 [Clostridium sp. MCC353]
MFLTGAFVLGEVLTLLPGLVVIGVLACLASGGLWFMVKKGRGRTILVLLFFFAAGILRMRVVTEQFEEPSLVETVDLFPMGTAEGVKAEGTVEEISRKSGNDLIRLGKCRVYTKDGAKEAGQILLYMDSEVLDSNPGLLKIGSSIRCYGELSEFGQPRNPGEFDSRTYYRGLKIRYRMFGTQLMLLNSSYSPWRDAVYRVKSHLSSVLERISEPEDLGIFQAALLGEKENLAPEVRKLYQKNGIAHLLAISGLHIALIGAGIYRLFRLCGMSFSCSGLLSGLWIISYGMAVGGSSSVVRSVIMLLLMMLAEYLGRTYDLLSAASLAALLLLYDSPWLLFSAGFQLSFGAVFAIGIPGKWLNEQFKTQNPWVSALCVGAAIQWVTYPVIRYHYFEYPVYSILLNLSVIPLMTYVVCSGAAGMVLGCIWLKAGHMALGSGHYILRLYESICRMAAGFPGSSVVLGRPKLWQIGLYYSLMAVVFLLIKRGQEKKLPLKRMILPAALCFAVSILSLGKLPFNGMRITFVDVGQGDGILMEYEDLVVLVDGGSSSQKKLGEYTLEPFLKSRGISRIDYAFVTHGDMDHMSGIRYLLEEDRGISIDHLMLPYHREEDENCGELEQFQLRRGGTVCDVKRYDCLKEGELSIQCVYPGVDDIPSDANEESLVLEVELGAFRLVLTGDMSGGGEAELLEYGIAPATVLKAAHHGSRFSNTAEFLDRLKPSWTVISYGEGNRYGHPHQEVLERLNEKHSRIYETAVNGAVTVWTDGNRVVWNTWIP